MLVTKYPGIFTCPSCSALFTCLSYFQQHVKGHAQREGRKLYCCQHCRYSTEQEFNFQWHTMTHADEPPHSCNVCNKSEDVDTSSHQSSKSIKTETESEEEPASCSMVGKRSVATATGDDLLYMPSTIPSKYEEEDDDDDEEEEESEEEEDEDNQEQSGHLSLQPMIPMLNQNQNSQGNEISDDEDDEEEEVESEEDVETDYHQHTNQNSSDNMLVNYDLINQGPPYAESIDRMETSLTPMVPTQSRGRGKGNRKSRSINSNDSSDGTSLGEMRRKFHCSHCGKSFKTKSHLQRHILTHTGEKPYHCNRCGSKFNQSSSLRNHIIAIHTKEYPHHCSECGKGFLMPALLQKHAATSHRNK